MQDSAVAMGGGGKS